MNIEENLEKIYNTIDDIVNDLISFAEWKTENVCQVCGKQIYEENKVVSRGWIGYYCKECAEKNNIAIFEKERQQ